MAILAIGDLHGQWWLAEKALRSGYPVIFIGDYVDSFTLGAVDCVRTFLTVLEAVESEKAVALWGNHDLQYFDPRHRCGGYNAATQAHLNVIGHYRAYNALKFWHEAEGFVFTHGGISQRALDALGVDWQEFVSDNNNFHRVGRARGGFGFPGLVWCDWNREFVPVPEIKQIVGHTRGRGIRENAGNYCIDTLEDGQSTGLLVENGKVKTFDLSAL